MTIWAPVVAALGASFLTGVIGFGGIWWQQHRLSRAAMMQEKSVAYHLLITYSLSFSARAGALRNVMRSRSGLGEGVDVTFRLRKPVDQMELYDWLAVDFQPINDAWSKVQMIGTAEAVQAATLLLDACADLIAVATAPGTAHGKVAVALKSMAWTPEQDHELQAAIKRVVEDRESFIKIARHELGQESVVLPAAQADKSGDAGVTTPDSPPLSEGNPALCAQALDP